MRQWCANIFSYFWSVKLSCRSWGVLFQLTSLVLIKLYLHVFITELKLNVFTPIPCLHLNYKEWVDAPLSLSDDRDEDVQI